MKLLRNSLFGPFLLLAATAVSAQNANSLPFTLKALGHGVYAAIDDAKGDSGANAGFVIGDDGVLVVDTFENEKAAQGLLSEIRKLTPCQSNLSSTPTTIWIMWPETACSGKREQ